MRELTKENIKEFNELYHNFHDSYIHNISYDINKSQIELLIDVQWKGEPILKEDGKYNTNEVKLKMIFSDVEKCCIKEMFSWDFIYRGLVKYIKLDSKESLCFATDENDPDIYIVCGKIQYVEL